MRLIVTRPAAQAAPWVRALRARGCDALALPLIEIAPLADLGPLRQAWAGLAGQALVMFVSANAVEQFFAARPEARRPGEPGGAADAGRHDPASPAWPPGVLAGSTGPGTSAALRRAGVDTAALVEPAPDAPRRDSEALWLQLQHHRWAGRSALIVRGEEGRDWLAETLRAQGARVSFVAAYRRLLPQPDSAGLALLAAAQAEPTAHLWLFSSSEAVANLSSLCPGADWSAAQALASHPRIIQAARAAGFGAVGSLPDTVGALADLMAQGGPLQSSDT